MAKNISKLHLIRKYKKEEYTIGILYVNDEYFCETVEDTDRGLTNSMSLSEITKKKVYGKTAIPTGTYTGKLTYSNKFKKTLPLIENVPGFSGIRIHSGNTADDSLGCVIVGQNKIKGGVINSRVTFEKLMNVLRNKAVFEITIE